MTHVNDAKSVQKDIEYIHKTLQKLISPPDHMDKMFSVWNDIGEALLNRNKGIESIQDTLLNLISPTDHFEKIFTSWKNIGEILSTGHVVLPEPFDNPDIWHHHDMGSLFYKLNPEDDELNGARKFKDDIIQAIFLNYPILKMHIDDYLKHACTSSQ